MRGTSPALAMSEVEECPSGDATHVDSDDDAEKGSIDARNDCRQSLLASAPISRNRLSTVMATKIECMLSLLSHAKSLAILLRWKFLLIKGFLRWA
jgi:hypothetical protein